MAPRIRVLLVDDHTTFRQALRTDLESFDNVEIVGEAVNGEDAVVTTAKLRPTVVVMDINMPKMDGITATRVIKAQHPEIVIIGFSVDAKNYQLHAMQKAGAWRIMRKGTSVAELHGALQEAVAALGSNLPVMSKEAKDKQPATLGDVLYANSKTPVPEREWETLLFNQSLKGT
jgi:DNA-binding NarL/FixJ family response regulator